MIKYLCLLILLPIFLTSGCHPQHKAVTFKVPQGEIEKGSSMSEVMDLLGNPQHIKSYNKTEEWSYQLEGDKRVNVLFLDGQVVEVK
jgi:prepilin-type processing-associated H-X9-DG protein